MWHEGAAINTIAQELGRERNAVRACLMRFGLYDPERQRILGSTASKSLEQFFTASRKAAKLISLYLDSEEPKNDSQKLFDATYLLYLLWKHMLPQFRQTSALLLKVRPLRKTIRLPIRPEVDMALRPEEMSDEERIAFIRELQGEGTPEEKGD